MVELHSNKNKGNGPTTLKIKKMISTKNIRNINWMKHFLALIFPLNP